MSTKGKAARRERRKAYKSNKGGVKTTAKRVRKSSRFKMHLSKFMKKWGSKNPRTARSMFSKAHAATGGSRRSAMKQPTSFGQVAASADSEMASDLRGVLHESRVQSGLRAEVVERLNGIFELISEMCNCENVDAVLAEALVPVNERLDAGTLTEDALDDGEFVGALAPCLNVVKRMMENVEAGAVDFDYSDLLALTEEDEEDDLGN